LQKICVKRKMRLFFIRPAGYKKEGYEKFLVD
jgi:hypothetical protein